MKIAETVQGHEWLSDCHRILEGVREILERIQGRYAAR